MRHFTRILIAFFAFLLILSISCTAQAFSFGDFFGKVFSAPKPVKQNRVIKRSNVSTASTKLPTQVKIGTYILHVGKYDLQSAAYSMDFYLIFKCNPVCSDINFEIMNAVNSTVRLIDKKNDTLVYRIQASLNKSNNLRNYPFDSHTLDIIVEDRNLTNDKIVFEADPTTTALDDNLEVAGFQLLPAWTAKVSDHYYKVFQRTYSSYKFSMLIKRPYLAGILKGILPALIIVLCNFLALFIKTENVSQRLGIATSTLIAAEVFHLNLTSSLPPLGYITFADMFMFINYIFLLMVIAEVVLTMFFMETQHKSRAIYVNRIASVVIPLLWFTFQTINWISFNPGALPTSS